ncbi:hypothetical protein [Paenibacillus herberti]|uniref:Uncharacterized protein n=1 Tax=Paenibacillus herberti TaxID=1619309 RepID=A0A229NZL1_9BACL|nr:hypothetical protein [Paenibacillus herberti]OXM15201.1 hypothetical protein CGZ75_00155 [Paenibacillus herberti]
MKDKGLRTYSFQTDLVIEAHNHDEAEVLLKQLLDTAGLSRYRLGKGSLIGFSISEEPAVTPNIGVAAAAEVVPEIIPTIEATTTSSDQGLKNLALDMIRCCLEDGRLVRLSINRGKGVQLSVPCRIINLDEETGLLTVYHVDEKQVYTFSIGEIDDFVL